MICSYKQEEKEASSGSKIYSECPSCDADEALKQCIHTTLVHLLKNWVSKDIVSHIHIMGDNKKKKKKNAETDNHWKLCFEY